MAFQAFRAAALATLASALLCGPTLAASEQVLRVPLTAEPTADRKSVV